VSGVLTAIEQQANAILEGGPDTVDMQSRCGLSP
jgi:hypothetical protein